MLLKGVGDHMLQCMSGGQRTNYRKTVLAFYQMLELRPFSLASRFFTHGAISTTHNSVHYAGSDIV